MASMAGRKYVFLLGQGASVCANDFPNFGIHSIPRTEPLSTSSLLSQRSSGFIVTRYTIVNSQRVVYFLRQSGVSNCNSPVVVFR